MADARMKTALLFPKFGSVTSLPRMVNDTVPLPPAPGPGEKVMVAFNWSATVTGATLGFHWTNVVVCMAMGMLVIPCILEAEVIWRLPPTSSVALAFGAGPRPELFIHTVHV